MKHGNWLCDQLLIRLYWFLRTKPLSQGPPRDRKVSRVPRSCAHHEVCERREEVTGAHKKQVRVNLLGLLSLRFNRRTAIAERL